MYFFLNFLTDSFIVVAYLVAISVTRHQTQLRVVSFVVTVPGVILSARRSHAGGRQLTPQRFLGRNQAARAEAAVARHIYIYSIHASRRG